MDYCANHLDLKLHRGDFSEDELALMDARVEQLKSHYQVERASVSSIMDGIFSHISVSSRVSLVIDGRLEKAPASVAVARDLPTIIDDLALHPTFKSYKFVKGPPFLRFYAAVSVKTTSGIRVGVLAIAHPTPVFNFTLKDAEYLIEEAKWYGPLFSSAIDRRQSGKGE